MTYLACIIYASAMIGANASVAYFGPWVSFFLIGLDLALRDWLHFRLKPWQMGLLIAVSGFLTWAMNAAPAQIAIASAVAFTVSACVDWSVFSALARSVSVPAVNIGTSDHRHGAVAWTRYSTIWRSSSGACPGFMDYACLTRLTAAGRLRARTAQM